MTSPRSIVILGSTGSIGTQALEVVAANPARFQVTAISAGGGNLDRLARQAVVLDVQAVGVARGEHEVVAAAIHQMAGEAGRQGFMPQILVGDQASTDLAASGADVVLNGITGSIGLRPTLAALTSGSTLALANKESLIVGGSLVKAAAVPGQIVPVDSEHSAIAQCLRGGTADEVRKLVITASGGPFRGRTRAELESVTPEQALAHPTWAMGPVITTNSATLVNKGLEVIEAHLLFDIPFERIEVVVHPQSLVHSMVEFVDGSTIAQVSPPSMLIPIALMGGAAGPCSPAVFNAANEECVAAFLHGSIRFVDIVDTVGRVVDEWSDHPENNSALLDVDTVLSAETWARRRARAVLGLTGSETLVL
ncbi:MAG: 1-deoxy-D-xylulose-5-phosphate reductoisomerase [Phycicoccus sp.]|nr:1-deoxy-D-xylulose-5-phosphate reductoisomerase [Phycicoccus sp.]